MTVIKPPKQKPTEQTFEEPKYLKHLIENHIPVCAKLEDDSLVTGLIEYYDAAFIRITQDNGRPNLFLFKHQIKYLYEV
ncbi:MAG TPA: hypothetical protein VM120_14605 [Bryobacteraceae bacterium]|nr:hypothetical protein [Bryobacteraceae bacterium]